MVHSAGVGDQCQAQRLVDLVTGMVPRWRWLGARRADPAARSRRTFADLVPYPVGYLHAIIRGMSSGPLPPESTAPRCVGQAGAEEWSDGLTRVDVLLAMVGIIAGLALLVAVLFFADFFLAPNGFWGGHAPSTR